MKIKREHVDYIRTAICRDSKAPTLDEYKTNGLSEKRWRWDLTYRAGLTKWICDNIYPYANDEHLDTALRHITGTK
jgi:hypothetical protein